MAATASRCPNPECRTVDNFEAADIRVASTVADGRELRVVGIQCASCGTVISFLYREDIPHYVTAIAEKLGVK
jgi:hypothetical protein